MSLSSASTYVFAVVRVAVGHRRQIRRRRRLVGTRRHRRLCRHIRRNCRCRCPLPPLNRNVGSVLLAVGSHNPDCRVLLQLDVEKTGQCNTRLAVPDPNEQDGGPTARSSCHLIATAVDSWWGGWCVWLRVQRRSCVCSLSWAQIAEFCNSAVGQQQPGVTALT